MKRIGTIVAAVALVASAAVAATTTMNTQSKPLETGDTAPAFEVDQWVKGDQVASFENGHIYVVEFWATWCGPCVRAIPHMTKVQKQFKDQNVHVIGMTSKDGRQDFAKVKSFVQKQGDAMDYSVAFVNNGRMWEKWGKAAGRRGIPSAFVVDHTGSIAWIGHPAQGMDKALAAAIEKRDTAAH